MAPKRGRSDRHRRDRRARNRAREDKADGPDGHSSGNQGEQAVLNRPVVSCLENRGMPGIPHHPGIHRPVRWVDQDSPDRFGIRIPANRGQWDVLSGWDIHCREERRNPAAQIRPDARCSVDRHTGSARSPDIHSRADRSKGPFRVALISIAGLTRITWISRARLTGVGGVSRIAWVSIARLGVTRIPVS